MNDNDLLRYSKQIMLPQIDIDGQNKLFDTTILMVGLGGLGSISSQYLAASGIGHLILADFDRVEISNLSRQTIHYTEDIGKLKIQSAKEKLLKINPAVKITLVENLDDDLDFWLKKCDIVLDGTDNFATRFLINDSCVKNHKPLISASVIRMEGQLAVFNGHKADKPCYQCLYSKDISNDENCTNSGILSPLAGVLGSMQALMTLKFILKIGELLDEKLLLIDANYMEFRSIKLKKDKFCKCCKI